MPTDEDIQRVVKVLAEKFRPQKIILFGSRAYGTPRPDSDADLLIILPFECSNYRMAVDMLGAIRPSRGYDLIPRTPEDIAKRRRWRDPMIVEATERGVVLFEAAA